MIFNSNQEQKISSKSHPKIPQISHGLQQSSNRGKNEFQQNAQNIMSMPSHHQIAAGFQHEQESMINTINEENVEESTLVSKRPSRTFIQNTDSQQPLTSERSSKKTHARNVSDGVPLVTKSQKNNIGGQKISTPKKKIKRKAFDNLNKAYIEGSRQSSQR